MSWFYCPAKKDQAHTRLFVFPHAGGAPTFYSRWHRLLPAGVELHVVELPGRSRRHREPFASNWAAVVGAIATAAQPLWGEKNIFFGHSMGAWMAFEVALALEKVGRNLERVVFSASLPPPSVAQFRGRFRASMSEAELLQSSGGDRAIPAVILQDPVARDYFMKILRADLLLSEQFTYNGAKINSPSAVFWGNADSLLPKAEMFRWQDCCAQIQTIAELHGDHFSILNAEHLAPILFGDATA